MSIVIQLLQGGLDALLEYLSAHVLTCLVPAFFIAGAVASIAFGWSSSLPTQHAGYPQYYGH